MSGATYFLPDVVVIPAACQTALPQGLQSFNAFAQPLPLVVEVWSPSTGAYDFERKLAAYREHGDAEVWYLHPVRRTLTVWRLRSDGADDESRCDGDIVAVASFSGITIDLDELLS